MGKHQVQFSFISFFFCFWTLSSSSSSSFSHWLGAFYPEHQVYIISKPPFWVFQGCCEVISFTQWHQLRLNSNVSLQCYHHGGPYIWKFWEYFSLYSPISCNKMAAVIAIYLFVVWTGGNIMPSWNFPLDKLLHPMHSLE